MVGDSDRDPSESSEPCSLPDELPMWLLAPTEADSAGVGDLAIAELEASAGVVDLPVPMAEPPTDEPGAPSSRGDASGQLPEARLVPRVPARAGRGRGRGRKRSSGPSLVPQSAQPQPAPEQHVALQNAQGSSDPTIEDADSRVAWCGPEFRVEDARAQATVEHQPELGLGRPAYVGGFAMPPKGASAVAAAAALGSLGEHTVEDDVARVARLFLTGSPTICVSVSALSVVLGVDRQKLPSLLDRLASAMCLLSHARASRIEAALLAKLPRGALAHCIESVQYDETPLTTRLLGDPRVAQRGAGRASSLPIADAPADPGTLWHIGQTRTLKVSSSAAPEKVVHTQGEIALVLRLGDQSALTSRGVVCQWWSPRRQITWSPSSCQRRI